MMKKPYVVVQCIVYNHEKFLRECLDSIVNQHTDFSFVVVVHDDKSTDSSVSIILEYQQKYPDLIVPVLEEENQWSKKDGSLQRKMFEAVQSYHPKYIAICEGDDYWTDMNKLQTQYDILEKDDTLMAVATESCVVDEDSNLIRPIMTKQETSRRYNLREFFRENPLYPTASVFYRNSRPEEVERMFEYTITQFVDDWNLWIAIHVFGDFYFLKENMVAYRIQSNSITHTNSRVDRAKANRQICYAVADVLPEEYADIAKDLRNTDWVWISLIHAYRKERKYILMCHSMLMATIKCPCSFWKEIKKMIVRSFTDFNYKS